MRQNDWLELVGELAGQATRLQAAEVADADAVRDLACRWFELNWAAITPRWVSACCRASQLAGMPMLASLPGGLMLWETEAQLADLQGAPAAPVMVMPQEVKAPAKQRKPRKRSPANDPEPPAPEPAPCEEPEPEPAASAEPEPTPAPAQPKRRILRPAAERRVRKYKYEGPLPQAEAIAQRERQQRGRLEPARNTPAPEPQPRPPKPEPEPLPPGDWIAAAELAEIVGGSRNAALNWARRHLGDEHKLIHKGRLLVTREPAVEGYSSRTQRESLRHFTPEEREARLLEQRRRYVENRAEKRRQAREQRGEPPAAPRRRKAAADELTPALVEQLAAAVLAQIRAEAA